MSAEIVNLRRARKAKARADHAAEGAASRLTHGLSSRTREAAQREAKATARRLDGHRLDRAPGPNDGDAA